MSSMTSHGRCDEHIHVVDDVTKRMTSENSHRRRHHTNTLVRRVQWVDWWRHPMTSYWGRSERVPRGRRRLDQCRLEAADQGRCGGIDVALTTGQWRLVVELRCVRQRLWCGGKGIGGGGAKEGRVGRRAGLLGRAGRQMVVPHCVLTLVGRGAGRQQVTGRSGPVVRQVDHGYVRVELVRVGGWKRWATEVQKRLAVLESVRAHTHVPTHTNAHAHTLYTSSSYKVRLC